MLLCSFIQELFTKEINKKRGCSDYFARCCKYEKENSERMGLKFPFHVDPFFSLQIGFTI